MEAAVDWLRKKGLAKAAKKAGRVAAEGLIGIARRRPEGRRGRGQFRDRLRRPQRSVPGPGEDDRRGRARRSGPTSSAIKAAKRRRRAPSRTRSPSAIATIGENMTLRRAAALAVDARAWSASYVHNAVADGLGKIGVLVALESTGKADELAAFGRQVAMHVAAANPQALDPSRPRSRRGGAREGRAGRQGASAGQARQRDREDRRVRASRPSTRKSACSISPSSSTTRRASRRR